MWSIWKCQSETSCELLLIGLIVHFALPYRWCPWCYWVGHSNDRPVQPVFRLRMTGPIHESLTDDDDSNATNPFRHHFTFLPPGILRLRFLVNVNTFSSVFDCGG